MGGWGRRISSVGLTALRLTLKGHGIQIPYGRDRKGLIYSRSSDPIHFNGLTWLFTDKSPLPTASARYERNHIVLKRKGRSHSGGQVQGKTGIFKGKED